LLLLYALAAASQIVLGIRPHSDPVLYSVALAGAAFAVFLIGGAIPVIVWAFKRFSREATEPVMVFWIIMMGGVVYLQWYSTHY
jgi:hypothetical protein